MININEMDFLKPILIKNYETLHQHPELGFEEQFTSKYIAEQLRSYGVEVTTGVAVTGVIGIVDSGKPGKTVMLRADMDALPVLEVAESEFKSQTPGKMHACGHDAHMSMLLGAAQYLSQNKDLFKGKIMFIFQPAEEGCSPNMFQKVKDLGYSGTGGAGFMIQLDALDGVDACFAIHVSPNYNTGTVYISKKAAMASSDIYHATIIGTGGHGAVPQNAIDPVGALPALIDAYLRLPAREISAMETVVISIGTINSSADVWNIIPERIEITGGVRTFNEDIREFVFERLEAILSGITKANRCTYEFKHIKSNDPTINDENMSASAAKNASALFGTENVTYVDIPFMTSEDVGKYFRKVPGALMWIGVKNPEWQTVDPLHSPAFHIDTNALINGVALHVCNAVEYLNNN